MRTWLRTRIWVHAVWLAGLIVALALFVNRGRGQQLPDDLPEAAAQPPWTSPVPSPGEPPMVDAPNAPQSPRSPDTPFTPPQPTPLGPGQAVPFTPELPFMPGMATEPSEPVVRLRVRAPAKAQPDKEIDYHLIVENVSRADAHHVLVRDRVPQGLEENAHAEPKETRQDKTKNGATDFIWDLGTLKAGARKEIALTLKPKGTDEIQNSAYVQFEHGQTVKTKITQPALSLRIIAPVEAAVPNAVVFRLEVTNNGETAVEKVIVKCQLPEKLVYGESKPPVDSQEPPQWKLGKLKPGETRRLQLDAVPINPGSYTFKAEATAAGGVSKKASADVTVGESKISISTSGPMRRLVKRPIPYLITVSNNGSMPLTNVQVTDEVPPGVEFVKASPGGTLQQGHVRWPVGTLQPGERRPLWMVIQAPSPGWCGNTVTARADNKQFDKARSNMTRVDNPNGLVIEIDRDSDWLEVGQKTPYTIHLLNPGKTVVSHVRLVIKVPPELSIRGQTGKTTGAQKEQVITFDPLDLEPNQKEKYTVEVEATKAGEAVLRAHWTDGRRSDGTIEEWEDRTIIRAADKITPRPAPTNLQVRKD